MFSIGEITRFTPENGIGVFVEFACGCRYWNGRSVKFTTNLCTDHRGAVWGPYDNPLLVVGPYQP